MSIPDFLIGCTKKPVTLMLCGRSLLSGPLRLAVTAALEHYTAVFGYSFLTEDLHTAVPNEIEVEIWVREQCSACDQWFRNIKEDAAKRRSGMIAANEPRVRWVVRTDDPPKQVAAFPYWRFVIGGRVFEATGNTSPGGVIHDYRKWLATFRQ